MLTAFLLYFLSRFLQMPVTILANLLFLLVSSVTISANPFTIPANPFTIPANEKAPRSRGFRRKVNHSVAGFLFIFFVFQPSKATQAILVEFMLRSAAVQMVVLSLEYELEPSCQLAGEQVVCVVDLCFVRLHWFLL